MEMVILKEKGKVEMMKKKIYSVLLAVMVFVMGCLGLTGCGNQNGGDGGKTGEKIKIGVIMYGYNDDQGKNTKEYCSYLEQNFNVEFAYEATNYNDDAQISCLENLISSGCKAVISAYDTSLESAIQTCEAAGVYYVLALDYASPADAKNVNSSYFLGGTKQFGGDEAALGEMYAQAFLSSGYHNVGGVSFPEFAFVEAPAIYASFQNVIEAAGDYTVSDPVYASGFQAADIQTATGNAIGSDTEVIFGMASGLDYVYPELKNNHPNVRLIALGYNDSADALIEAGTLIAGGTNNYIQSIASSFVRIMNAVDKKTYADTADGQYNQSEDGVTVVNGVAGYPVYDKSSIDDFKTYAMGRGAEGMNKGAVTAEELKTVLLSENSGATLADLNKLTSRTVAEIKAARQ